MVVLTGDVVVEANLTCVVFVAAVVGVLNVLPSISTVCPALMLDCPATHFCHCSL